MATEDLLHGVAQNNMPSNEHGALIDFARGLESCDSASEPGIADECSIRKEAKLLMSLHSHPPKLDGEELEPTSSSSENESVADVLSPRRHSFSFVCPSLSLEGTSRKDSTAQHHLSTTKRPPSELDTFPKVSDSEDNDACSDVAVEFPPPAVLLGRPLKVDDRDALRLSADAMARNVLNSFRKATVWRIQAWIQSLSSILVNKEREMLQCGASQEDLKALLCTAEAQLVIKLQEVSEQIQVTAAGTNFRVLPQRVRNKEVCEPARKKGRYQSIEEASELVERADYQYTVVHALVLDCAVSLQTPAGYSEITLEVPGTMEGKFLSIEGYPERLVSVVVELNTDILAAMVEKSCRMIVRTSVELAMNADQDPEEMEEGSLTTSSVNDLMPSPPPREIDSHFSADYVRAALVSPGRVVSGNPRSGKGILRPIPDDLDEKKGPSRISPHPASPSFDGRTPFIPQTPKLSATGASLVSPPPNEKMEYEDSAENGPSLPLLVQVACREMHSSD